MSSKAHRRKQNPLKEIQKFLGSWGLAIPMMFIIGVLSIMGGVVPQGTIAQTQNNAKLAEWLKPLIIGLQLNDVYRSPIFLVPLLIFFLSLVIVTADKVIPRLYGYLAPKRAHIGVKALKNMDPVIPYPQGVSDQDMKTALKQFGYKVRYQDNERAFFEKGRMGRFSALVTHIGLFSIIIGAVIGALSGFKAQVALVDGQVKNIGEIIDNAETRGKFTPRLDKWNIKLDSFYLEHHPNGQVSQYDSQLQILDNQGKELESKLIWVNNPLIYKEVYFYQASWGMAGLKARIGDEVKDLSLKHIPMMKASVTGFQNAGNAQFTFFVDPNNSVYLFDGNRQPLASNLMVGQNLEVGGKSVKLLKLDGEHKQLQLRIGDEQKDLKLQKVPQMQRMQLYVTPFQVIGDNKYTFVFNPNTPDELSVFDASFQPLITPMEEGETRIINGVPVTLMKKQLFTGLQIKLDYGIPMIIVSFVIIMLGVSLALFPHREVWLVSIDGQRHLVGRTNKMRLAFLQDLKRVFLSFELDPAVLKTRSDQSDRDEQAREEQVV